MPFDGGPYGIANASKMFGYGANSSQLTGQLEWQDYYGLIEPLTITLASSTYAIGMNLGELYGTNLNYGISLNQSGDNYIVSGMSNGPSFFGAVSTTPFSSITIFANRYSASQSFNQFQLPYVAADIFPLISNLTVASVPSVPEPESYGMMMLGLGLMGFMTRHRKV